MADKCVLFVCANYSLEAKAVIEEENLCDINLVELPVTCLHPSRFTPLELSGLVKEKTDDSDYICLLPLCRWFSDTGIIENLTTKLSYLNCFEILINRELILDYLRNGAYLISSGMLTNWRNYISELGLDEHTVHDFFGKSVNFLLWLDTGVDKDGERHIRQFSEFAGLPYQKLPVGLDHIRLLISKVFARWQAEKERKKFSKIVADLQRQIADYAMALDLMGNISGAVSETEVINNVLQLFNAICAPKTLIYIPYADSRPGEPVHCSVDKRSNQSLATAVKASDDLSSGTETKSGFTVNIKRKNDLLGKIYLDDFEFPQYRNYYLNFALSTTNVISLAVYNSRIYERLIETRKDLEGANKELEAFSYSVAHDLRIPLRTITGFGEFLMEDSADNLGETGADYLKRIISSAKRMSQLIDDLLRLAKIGTQKIVLTQINLSEMVKEITDNLKSNEPRRNASFDIKKDVLVTADSSLIRIALENLLFNAWKFTAKNPQTHISFGESIEEGKRVYYIEDNGAGFNMENAGQLFEPFQRLHSGKGYQGTGIGLSIVKRVIQRHGGKIWAKGEKNKGAVFYFTLK